MKILSITLVLICTLKIIPQIDTTRKEFYPLQIGNIWQYSTENNQIYTAKIKADTIIDGIIFYEFERVGLRTSGSGITRIDSLLRIQTRWGGQIGGDKCGGNTPYESSVYRLAEQDSSLWEICESFNGILGVPLTRFNRISSVNIFGETREIMSFNFGGAPENEDTIWNYGAILAKGIGVIEEQYFDGGYRTLQGAVINGIQYGTIVSVEEVSKTVPDEITLYQNYPNPFNPTTLIRYSIKESGLVSLKVFDILGKEVAVLVNEVKPVGVYETEFNAVNLPSGVYIYSLRVNGFVSYQKMILLK